eukprot:TRINITY_DN585_c0_g1_i1.p1 TRINITY_DN585_c0_g1~~TRINITY_DN585_c0_g1_i1.p1  ORF type:complete len:373 (-),score=100.81 TRINITY_DN585_c0_g1_i1:50-1168(-)
MRTVLVSCLTLLSVVAGSSSFNFLTVGDWGEVNSDQSDVASAMADWAGQSANQPINFIISVGDNFYQDGVSSVDDSQWQSTFSDVYNQYDSLKSLPWYAVLGNHDYHQNADAQIQYSAVSAQWKMPGHYFSTNYTGAGWSVKFVYIDTIWFGPTISKHTKITNPDEKFQEQYDWLEAELQSGQSFDWLIVIGHYPLFSEGDGDDQTMMDAMQDLLEKYQVDAYISGHDHTMQHLTQNDVQYLISGNGAIRGKLKASSSAKVNFAKVEPGFTLHKIQGKSMSVQYVGGASGEVMYEYTQQARQRSSASSLVSNFLLSKVSLKESVSTSSHGVLATGAAGALMFIAAAVAVVGVRRHRLNGKLGTSSLQESLLV